MKRVLYISDSVGLPRPKVGADFDVTYLKKLEQMSDNLWILAGAGEPIYSRYQSLSSIAQFLPDKFFDLGTIQVGIIDCAPRPMPYTLKQIVGSLPWGMEKPIIQFLHVMRPLLIKVGFYQFTPLAPFTNIFGDCLEKMSRLCDKVCVIGIAPVIENLERRSPGYGKEIKAYNQAIQELAKKYPNVTYIPLDCLSSDPGLFLTDDAHVKPPAYAYIWTKMQESM